MSESEPSREFPTGARRGTDASLRYDLVPLAGLRRLAAAATEGVSKYGVGDWLKGLTTSNLLAHAWEHLVSYSEGDRSEDHLGHCLWNLAAICHNEARRPDLHDAPPSQVEGFRPDPTETEVSPPDDDVWPDGPYRYPDEMVDRMREVSADPGIPNTFHGERREVATSCRVDLQQWPLRYKDGRWWFAEAADVPGEMVVHFFGRGDEGCERAYRWILHRFRSMTSSYEDTPTDDARDPAPQEEDVPGIRVTLKGNFDFQNGVVGMVVARDQLRDLIFLLMEEMSFSETAIEAMKRIIWEAGRWRATATPASERRHAMEDRPPIEEVVSSMAREPLRHPGVARSIEEASAAPLAASDDVSLPSGLNSPGLVEKSYPLHPSDQGWDEWKALIDRVDRSHYRPWWDERAGWCVRRAGPHDGEDGAWRWMEIIGKGRWSMHRAYEFAARQLDIVGNPHHPGEA